MASKFYRELGKSILNLIISALLRRKVEREQKK